LKAGLARVAAQRLDGAEIAPETFGEAHDREEKGEQLFRRGDYDDAREAFEEAARLYREAETLPTRNASSASVSPRRPDRARRPRSPAPASIACPRPRNARGRETVFDRRGSMHEIQPARFHPGASPSSLPEPPARDSAAAGSVAPVRGRALILWDPKNLGRKLDAIDTDQITPSADCVSESLETLDERWKAGSFAISFPISGVASTPERRFSSPETGSRSAPHAR
jgi:hypothetical protein